MLFICDDSIFAPVLRSQGLPIVKRLSEEGMACSIVSFEDQSKRIPTGDSVGNKSLDLTPRVSLRMIPFRPSRLMSGWAMIYFKGIKACMSIIGKSRISVIHARSLIPAMIALSIKRFVRGEVKVIYDYRGVFIEEQIYMGHWKKQSWKVKCAQYLESANLARADCIVAVSNAMKTHLLEKYFSETKDVEKKIHVIPNKTRIIFLHRAGVSAGAAKGEFVGVYSGSAAAWQCIPEMVQLCKTAAENSQKFTFKILTYEDKSLFLRHFHDDQNLLKRLQIIGMRPNEVSSQLSAADFGILLRENHLVNRVASPLKFAEYLANGLAVVVSEGIGDTEEIIKKYRVGVVVRNRDYHSALNNLVELLHDGSLRERCYAVAQKEFNLEDAIDDYRALYSDLLEEA